MRTALKYFALAICTISVFAILPFLYIIPDALDPQGDKNASCFTQALPAVSNGNGMLVSGRQTFCDNVVHDSAIYLYLHKSGEPDSHESLIFRYADDPNVAPPRVEWTNRSTLSVSVGNVIQITKLVPSHDGINVVYSIGHENIARETWSSDVYKLKLLELALFTVMLTVVACGGFILRSIRREARKRSA